MHVSFNGKAALYGYNSSRTIILSIIALMYLLYIKFQCESGCGLSLWVLLKVEGSARHINWKKCSCLPLHRVKNALRTFMQTVTRHSFCVGAFSEMESDRHVYVFSLFGWNESIDKKQISLPYTECFIYSQHTVELHLFSTHISALENPILYLFILWIDQFASSHYSVNW